MQHATDPVHDPEQRRSKGSILLGVLLFLAILAASALLGSLIFTVINAFGMGYSRDALFLPALPVLLFIGALIYLLAKRKTRTAWGMAVPFLITLALVALGVISTLGKLASLGIR